MASRWYVMFGSLAVMLVALAWVLLEFAQILFQAPTSDRLDSLDVSGEGADKAAYWIDYLSYIIAVIGWAAIGFAGSRLGSRGWAGPLRVGVILFGATVVLRAITDFITYRDLSGGDWGQIKASFGLDLAAGLLLIVAAVLCKAKPASSRMMGGAIGGGAALLALVSLIVADAADPYSFGFITWTEFLGFDDWRLDAYEVLLTLGVIFAGLAMLLSGLRFKGAGPQARQWAAAAGLGAAGIVYGIGLILAAVDIDLGDMFDFAQAVDNARVSTGLYFMGVAAIVMFIGGPTLIVASAMGLVDVAQGTIAASATPAAARKPPASRSLRCPQCKNVVQVAPGAKPKCNSCGFGS